MNIGVCVRHTREDMREKFASAAREGFKHCQLVSWEPSLWTDESAKEILSLCAEFDLTITAFWCGWEGPKHWNFIDGPGSLGLVPEAYRFHRMQNLLDGAAFADLLGVSDVVTHMGFIPENPGDENYLGVVIAVRYVANALKARGQNLLFETGQETPVTLLRMISDAGTDNLFVNLDPANLILYGKGNPVDALDVLGDYVRGVHAKDGRYPTDGHALGHETPIGAGKVDFFALLKGLKAHGYDGSLTIEREISGEKQTQDIRAGRDYLLRLLEEMA